MICHLHLKPKFIWMMLRFSNDLSSLFKISGALKRSQNYEKERTVPVDNAFVVKNHQQPYEEMSQCM